MRIVPGATALLIGLVLHAAAPAGAQAPPGGAAAPSFSLWEFGSSPRPAYKMVLIGMPAIQAELKLTTAQKKALERARSQYFAKIQKARREIKDQKKFLAAREGMETEVMGGVLAILDSNQRDRLSQIQLQAQGPLALTKYDGPDLAERLGLTADQTKRARTIADAGGGEIEKAGLVLIPIDPKAAAPTPESVRALVKTPEFKAAKQKARESARKAWAAVMGRIEEVMTEPQRAAYHRMLGAPFDLSTIRPGGDEESADAGMVAQALRVGGGGGGGGGQQADPGFKTKVDRPAYAAETHPRVLFDEAHDNFHTTGGRYKPFADLIASDGYRVTPNRERFTKAVLDGADILIIANAMAGGGGAEGSAFSDAECDAVRDWVRAGGSLLLITDHAPFGAASEPLSKRFGVDMSKGFTSDPSNSEGGESWLVFSRQNKLLGDHPVTNGRDASERVNRVQTFTGQSLKGPAGSVALYKLAPTAVDQTRDGETKSAAGRAQGLALAFGRGRVVVLGEAAELSAQLIGVERFGMNVPGLDNRQMALNIMHWLSGLLEPRKKAG
jgi:hypothetical protein